MERYWKGEIVPGMVTKLKTFAAVIGSPLKPTHCRNKIVLVSDFMKDKIRERAERYHVASGCPIGAGSNERPLTETVLTYDARRNKTLERDAHVGRWNWLEVGPCPAQSVERN